MPKKNDHGAAGHPIDIVLPWVDGSDPLWRRQRQAARERMSDARQMDSWFDHDIRYRDWDSLRFLFRGIEGFAPWVRKVHFITSGHLPAWLNTDCPRLSVVRHEAYIPRDYLPTFNSHTIELNLHRIEGLAEHFIYFNDDIFLTAPVAPEDFFREGLPCDAAILNPVPMTRDVKHAEVWNVPIINDHFDKNAVLKANPGKWFTPKYGKYLIRNLLLLPWQQFVGFYEPHLASAFLKETFAAVWRAEGDELDATCRGAFRAEGQVNQYLMKNWQLVTGRFSPRSLRVGRMYTLDDSKTCDEVCDCIRNRRFKMLCVNDSVHIDDFEGIKAALNGALLDILPEKSSFERA